MFPAIWGLLNIKLCDLSHACFLRYYYLILQELPRALLFGPLPELRHSTTRWTLLRTSRPQPRKLALQADCSLSAKSIPLRSILHVTSRAPYLRTCAYTTAIKHKTTPMWLVTKFSTLLCCVTEIDNNNQILTTLKASGSISSNTSFAYTASSLNWMQRDSIFHNYRRPYFSRNVKTA